MPTVNRVRAAPGTVNTVKKDNPPRTLDEIRALNKETLVPKDVAGYLGCCPYTINLQAKENPCILGFPVSVMGSRIKIPKAGFIRWAEGVQTSL